MSYFQKILIANRGEIAVRISRTARRMGIKTVVVYTKDEQDSLHVSQADEAVLIEGDDLFQTYLNQNKIIQIAKESNAQAIHPGYGFLSENADFAKKVENAGLIFIGATADQIRLMGQKMKANKFVKSLGIPIIPQITGSDENILARSKELGFPLLIKASGGGGGKGIEIVNKPDELTAAIQSAKRKAINYFADDKIIAEKYIKEARHIEVQILGDGQGNAIHLFERECSIQRNHQKLIEEAPATSVSQNVKKQLYQSALKIAKSIDYRGAGTIEFLVDKEDNFYFLEMNTRLQVEHPLTEMITGIDLVEEQLKIAAGKKLNIRQKDMVAEGHALELRICSENPNQQFQPVTGLIQQLHVPDNVRWDSFINNGIEISPLFDSLIGKLIVTGKNRFDAVKKMKQALNHFYIQGVQTNQEFLSQIINHQDFINNSIHTQWITNKLDNLLDDNYINAAKLPVAELLSAYILHHFFRPNNSKSLWKENSYYRLHNKFQIYINNQSHEIIVVKRNGSIQIDVDGEKYFGLTNCKFNDGKIEFMLGKKDIIVFICEKESTTAIHLISRQYELRSNHVINQVQLRKINGENKEIEVNKIVAGLYGKVINVMIKPGDRLQKGQDLIVIESMKSEITLKSPVQATVKNVNVLKGETVADTKTLVEFEV